MDSRLDELFARSFRTSPAQQANSAMEEVREAHATADGEPPRTYELVLTTWEAFASGALPRMVYHLESLGAHLPECAGVLVAAFAGETLRFAHARDVIAAAARLLSTTPEQLAARYGTGESRTARRGEPILLPPPRGKD